MARIVVVDDRPIDRQFLATLLGYGGHEVLEAADGAEALALVRRERPDLIISDIQMPTMDGYEFVRRLRADPDLAAIPLIFYTATYREREARDLARQCGVSHVLPKPTPPEILLQTVQAILCLPPVVPAPRHAPPAELPERSGTPPLGALTRQLAGYVDTLESTSLRMAAAAEDEGMPGAEQSHLREISGALSKTVEQLQAVSLRFALLLETSLELATQRQPARLMEIFCRSAHDICVAKYAVAAIIQEGEFLHLTARGIDLPALGDFNALPAGVLTRVAWTGQPCRLHGAAALADLGLPAAHPGLQSFLAVPIATLNRAYGWLYLADKLGSPEFSETDERMAMTLSSQLAVSYENVALYKELERYSTELEQRVRDRTVELELANRELESFSYSVSHDLRAPLRSVEGFGALLLGACQDKLDETGLGYLRQVRAATQRMARMIEALLLLATTTTRQMRRRPVDLSTLAREIAAELGGRDAARHIDWVIADGLVGECDPTLIRIVLENLLGNAWKYTSKCPAARIQFGVLADKSGQRFYFVKDNGAGFDPCYAGKLFNAFQRLHSEAEFEGTGIGLATVRRILLRHGGTILANARPGKGATFKFTLESGAG